MRTVEIKQVNKNFYEVSKRDSIFIAPALEYEKVYWQQGKYRKEKKIYKAYFWEKTNEGNFRFLIGNLRRVTDYLKSKDIHYTVEKSQKAEVEIGKVKLFSIIPRSDQIRLIEKGLKKKQGLIISPTGSGKTVIAMGIISALKKHNILFLAHTVDIVNQTTKRMIEELPELKDKTQMLYGGNSNFLKNKSLTVSTVQTFSNLDFAKLKKHFTVIIIDEVHHVNAEKSQYGKILKTLEAPYKLGFTATKNREDKLKEMSCEGLLGPVIGTLSVKEAIEKGIISKPKIKLHKVPYNNKVSTMHGKYAEIYDSGIVLNEVRNNLIKETAEKYIRKNKSVLILVNRIEHGEILADLLNAEFVRGETDKETREYVQKLLNKKEVMCVVATAVWKEGVDIPSVDVAMNAGGGKSEIQTLQFIGRGFRRTEEKNTFIVVDFFDNSHKYFINHFGERLTLYFEMGWM